MCLNFVMGEMGRIDGCGDVVEVVDDVVVMREQ